MKKIFVVFKLMSLVLLFSCQQEQEEVFYSCDDKSNEWVKSNLSTIQSMKRADWLRVNGDLKVPTYRAFTLKQKQEFWKLKLENVMNNQWEEKELEHLQRCYNALSDHPNWLLPNSLKSENDFDEFKMFVYTWVKYAREELGWSDSLIGAINGTGHDIEIKGEKPIIKHNSSSISRAKTSTEIECDCAYDNVIWTTCLWNRCEKSEGLCESTDGGCGFWYGDDCDGLCL